jgi:hypothetical protein
MKNIFGLFMLNLIISMSVFGQPGPGPMPLGSTPQYRPFETCNQGAITFYETYLRGVSQSPRQGIMMRAASDASGLHVYLSAVSALSNFGGNGLQANVDGYGAISIDANGSGQYNQDVYTPFTPAGGGTGYQHSVQVVPLNCRYLPPIPSGFSVGN